MKTTLLGVKFDITDIDANYEIIGNSDNYSFQYNLGKGSDLIDYDYEGIESEDEQFNGSTFPYSTSIDLYGNYGTFEVRVFAVSDIGVRSSFIQGSIDINPPEFNGTFSFSEIKLVNEGNITAGLISKTPTPTDNQLITYAEFANKEVNLQWSLNPPPGHSREGESLGKELLNDSLFDKFEVKIKNGEDYILIPDSELNQSESLQQYLSSANVSGSLSNYRNFSLKISSEIFNELSLDRSLSVEIKCFDSKGNTSIGEIFLKNPKPTLVNFQSGDKGLNSLFSWGSSDIDFRGVVVKYLALPGGVELISETDLEANGEYFLGLLKAQEYQDIKGKVYEQGEKVRYRGVIYEAAVQHQTKESGNDTSPENQSYWTEIIPVSGFIYREIFSRNNFFEITQLFGYNYFFAFQPEDGYGKGDIYNLTKDGLKEKGSDSVLRGRGSNLHIAGLSFYERKDDLVFNWDIVNERGERIDLNQYKVVNDQYDAPLVLGVSGCLFDTNTRQKVLQINQAQDSVVSVKSSQGTAIIPGMPDYEIFNKYEYTRYINNSIYGADGFPEDAQEFDEEKIYTPDYSPYYVTRDDRLLFNVKSATSIDAGSPYIKPSYVTWDSNFSYEYNSNVLNTSIVSFEGDLYKVIQDFGPESNSVEGVLNETLSYNVGDLVVAPIGLNSIFNSSSEYDAGEIVLYQGKIYICAKSQSKGNAIVPGLESKFWFERGLQSDLKFAVFECLNNLTSSLTKTPTQDPVNWQLKNPANSALYFEKYIEKYPLNIDEWREDLDFPQGSYAVYNNDIFLANKTSGPSLEGGFRQPDLHQDYWSTEIEQESSIADIYTNHQSGDLTYYYGAVFKCLADNPTGAPIIPVKSAREELQSSYENCQWRPFWEIDDSYESFIFGHKAIPESGKREIGFEVGIVGFNGDIISSQQITGNNPPPEILRQGFNVNSTSKASRVRFNFNYKEGFAEKTTKVNLYRSPEDNFNITGSNKFPYNSTEEAILEGSDVFVKTIVGEGESADFGDNITELFDDPPLFIDSEGIEHPTGYYYKILPFDDFGSGHLYGVDDNMHGLERVIVYPKSYHDPNPVAPIGEITKAIQPSLGGGQGNDQVILNESIPGPVVNLTGSTAFENYFLNWDIPNSERNSNNNLVKVIPNDIDHYEVWSSEFDHLEVNGQDLTLQQNASGYRRILGDLNSLGDIPEEKLDIGYDITNAFEILEVDGNSMSLEAIYKGLTNERKYFWIRAVDKAGNKSPFTGAAELPDDQLLGLELTLGQAKTTDIEHFEENLTEIFPNTLALVPNDPFSDNTSQVGSIAWDRHFVYYNGTGYVIGAGETADSFLYWSATGRTPTHIKDIVPLTADQSGELGLIGPGGGALDSSINNPLRNVVYSGGYDTSSYHPAGEGTSIGVDEAKPSLLGEEHDFIIARNAGGIATPMWHAFANALIGSAHIQDAAITNAKIHNLTADKIRSAEIYGQDIQVGGDDVSGQIRSAGFSGLNSTDINGDLAQGFAISGNGKFVFQTKNGKIYFEDDELTVEGNIRQKDGSNFTLLNVSASPNYFDYIETEANDIVPEYDSDYVKIAAYYKNIDIDPTEVRFKALGTDGYVYFDYNDNVNGLYDISGFKYNPALTASSAEFNISGGFDLGSNRATAVLDVSGFDAMIRNLNPAMNGSVVVFASGIDVGVEAATSIGILSDGAPGPTGRSPIYRGVWSDQKDYIGVLEGTNGFDNLRGDLVFLSGDYYISTNNSGPGLVGIGAKNPGLPEGENFWKTFGAQFESVATKLLLAEDAVITHSLIMGEEDPDNPGAGIGGVIKTVGKEFANGITGFFLANTGSALSGPNPQFDIGSDNSYIRFDGLSDKIEIKGTFINNSVQDPTIMFDSNNASDNLASFIGGGYNNNINFETGFASAVVGGGYNSITGRFSFIGGGFNNVVNDNFSAIVGGYNNLMPLLDSGNEGANFIGAGVQNTISGGTTQSIVNGFDNLISDQSSSFLYDPDNSIFSDKFLGKGVGETILTTDGYADNTRFPTDGSIDYWENGFFFSYHENDQIYSTKGLDSENWFYSIDFGWFFISELTEDIYSFDQQDKFPNWIYISGDSTLSPAKTGLGWTYFQSTHTQTGIDNTPNGVTDGEGIVFYQPSKTLNPLGSTAGWVYMCKDNTNTIYYSGANSNINWQPLNT